MAELVPVARQQYTDGNGAPLAGGSVTFCQPNTGGATVKAVWADQGQTIQLQNPVPLDASGITFSGGSQVSVWGEGRYEEFVRDADGNLIYSAPFDISGGLLGGTVAGDLTVLGHLEVDGGITSNGALTASQINGTNATFSGTVNAASLIGTANLTTMNSINANVSGDISVNGTARLNGTLDANNAAITNLSVNSLTVLTTTNLLTTRAGYGTTDVNGQIAVTFSPAFRRLALSMTSSPYAPNWETLTTSCGNLSTTGATGYAVDNSGTAAASAVVFWIAVGED